MEGYTDISDLKAQFQEKLDSIKMTEGKSGLHDFVYLTNELVIQYISEQPHMNFPAITSALGPLGCIFLFATKLGEIIDNLSTSTIKILFIAFSILFFIIFYLIGTKIEKRYNSKAKSFAEENYRDATILYTKVLHVYKTNVRHQTQYKIYFINEDGDKKSANISFLHYSWFKEHPNSTAYVLKMPKINNGYFYKALPDNDFKNLSSLSIINCIV
jgi:hypothetical protein